MGGKTLKYPSRAKFKPQIKENEVKSEPVSEEEHEKRIKMLKELGLLRE
ncbi:hypothetical protein HYW76_02095 [Candidatus Pacearchaeota archaeon]|nr:hypothetical protein [Candidatus Pacearchaeota archaeon]